MGSKQGWVAINDQIIQEIREHVKVLANQKTRPMHENVHTYAQKRAGLCTKEKILTCWLRLEVDNGVTSN
jgi:hypothetical protein